MHGIVLFQILRGMIKRSAGLILRHLDLEVAETGKAQCAVESHDRCLAFKTCLLRQLADRSLHGLVRIFQDVIRQPLLRERHFIVVFTDHGEYRTVRTRIFHFRCQIICPPC